MLKVDQIKDLVDNKATPGCVISVDNQEKVSKFAYGCYSDTDKTLVSENTIYDLASITKLYTTAIILRMHEKGDLDIFDKCSEYLEVFQNSNLKIFDLLTHKAGFNIRLLEYRNKGQD